MSNRRRYALMLYAVVATNDRYGTVFAVDDETMIGRLSGELRDLVDSYPTGELRRVSDGVLLWRKGKLDV